MSHHNLIVNFEFNPPVILIVGPIPEATIRALEKLLPRVTTSTTAPSSHQFEGQAGMWRGSLPASYANEEVGQSRLTLAMLDCLAEEGWGLKGSTATTYGDKVSYKYFFVQQTRAA